MSDERDELVKLLRAYARRCAMLGMVGETTPDADPEILALFDTAWNRRSPTGGQEAEDAARYRWLRDHWHGFEYYLAQENGERQVNDRHPRTIARVTKDEPGLGDDIPCSKCGSALDTGLECIECGYDMQPEIAARLPSDPKQSCPKCNTTWTASKPLPCPTCKGDWSDERDILLALKRLSHGYDACVQGKGLVQRAITEIEGLRAAFAVWTAIPTIPPMLRSESERSPTGGQGWRPIESAPKDGTHILIADFTTGAIGFGWPNGVHQPFCDVAHWFDDGAGESGFYSSTFGVDPDAFLRLTHWMPLPEPPKESGK